MGGGADNDPGVGSSGSSSLEPIQMASSSPSAMASAELEPRAFLARALDIERAAEREGELPRRPAETRFYANLALVGDTRFMPCSDGDIYSRKRRELYGR